MAGRQSAAARARGRNAKVAAKVAELVAFGNYSPAQIAHEVGLSMPTLRKHYLAELEHAKAQKNVEVARSLFSLATGKGNGGKPHAGACMFWLRARGGEEWRVELPQAEPPARKLGKKEAAEVLARVAEKGSEWEALLRPAAGPVPDGDDDEPA
jgi:hypothetical protein